MMREISVGKIKNAKKGQRGKDGKESAAGYGAARISE